VNSERKTAGRLDAVSSGPVNDGVQEHTFLTYLSYSGSEA